LLFWILAPGLSVLSNACHSYYSVPSDDFSPDGKAVYIEDIDGGEGLMDFDFGEIVIIDLETGNRLQVTKDKSFDTHPYWSSDGMRIVFESKRLKSDNPILGLSRESHIYTVDIRSGKIVQLDKGFNERFATVIGKESYTPAWCPTNIDLFAFVTKIENRGFKVILYNKASDSVEDLTEAGKIGQPHSLRWSNDGKYLALDVGIPSRVGIIDVATKEIVVLPNQGVADYLESWDCNSESLVCETFVSETENMVWRFFWAREQNIEKLSSSVYEEFYSLGNAHFLDEETVVFIGEPRKSPNKLDIYKLNMRTLETTLLTTDGHEKADLIVFCR